MSKLTNKVWLGIFIIVGAIVIVMTNQMMKPYNSNIETTINKDIKLIESFTVTAESTKLQTSAKGTISVIENKGTAKHLQIVAFIEIDPDDWGGVAFYIPHQWKISNIFSSYPEKDTTVHYSDFVTTWSTESKVQNDWNSMIEIGRSRGTYGASEGGSGTIIIDIINEKKQSEPEQESVTIGVEVGSSDKGSYKIMGTDFITVPISLIES